MDQNVFKTLREYLGLTQSELSREIGLSKALISDLETGRRLPSRHALDAYNKYFEMDDYQMAALNKALTSDGKLPKLTQLVLNVIKYGASKAQGRSDREQVKTNSHDHQSLSDFRKDLGTNKAITHAT